MSSMCGEDYQEVKQVICWSRSTTDLPPEMAQAEATLAGQTAASDNSRQQENAARANICLQPGRCG